MRCLYCDKNYLKQSSIIHYLFSKDPLCETCRQNLNYKPKDIIVNNIKVKALYEYNDQLKSLILQYKECNDEALKDVFFYDISLDILIKYYDYTIIWVPSTKHNKNKRGFDHMGKMLEILKLKKLDALEKIEEISQNNLSKGERSKMINNIKVKDGIKIPDKVLLIDDIVTTGSSIYGAYLAIKDKAKNIKLLALAYA